MKQWGDLAPDSCNKIFRVWKRKERRKKLFARINRYRRKIKSRTLFDEETRTRRLILIYRDLIRVTTAVNSWLRNASTRNTDETRGRVKAKRFVYDIISNFEQFKFRWTIVGIESRFSIFPRTSPSRYIGRANGDKFDQFVSP